MNAFLLEIYSPEGIIFKDTVTQALFPSSSGQIGILPHHAPLFTKLEEGEVHVKKGKEEMIVGITGGFLQVSNNTATVLADYAVKAESLELAKVERAKKEAEEALKGKKENVDFLLAEKELRKSLLDLKVAQRLKKGPK